VVLVSRPLLELVRERIDHGLDEARRMPLAGHIGAWLGVVEQPSSWTPAGGLRCYNDVAEAGAVLTATGDVVARASFEEGVAWLRKRRFFVSGQPAGLEADPIALVGVALGLDAIGAGSDARAWLAGIVREALKGERDVRRADLLGLALALAENLEADWSGLSALLQAALAKKGKVTPSAEASQAAFGAILGAAALEPEWAVFQAAALDTLFAMEAAIDLAQATVEQVVDLLRRVPAALKRWPWENKPKTQHDAVTTQRWDIQHEYHVQSLLWAVLRPVFPGLEDEENLPSLGQKHPRADLLVPGLRLVIEVKYLREANQRARADIIEDVAADTGLYLTDDSGYDRIIAFIWDATGSTHHHDELAAGLRKLRGVVDVVIVSRPGEWSTDGGLSRAR
jgi:hypothetical protein